MLELGVYKNWKELCDKVGWKTIRGDYKKARVKDLNIACKWHKDGNKIVITEIYGDLPMEEDKRANNGNNGHSTSKYTMIDGLIHNQLYGYERILTKNQIIQIIGISIDKDTIIKACNNVNEYTIDDFMEVYNSIIYKLIDSSLNRMSNNKTIEYSKVIVADNVINAFVDDDNIIENIESEVIQEMNIKNVYTLSDNKKKAFYNRCDKKAIEQGICQQYYYRAYELKKINDIENYNDNAKQELLKQICKSIKNSNAFSNKIEYSKSKFDKQKELMTNDDEWGESIYDVLGEEVILDNLSKADRNRLSENYMSDIDTIIDFILNQCK